MGNEATQYYVSHAVQRLDISQSLVKMLEVPLRVIKTDVVIQRDNGKLDNFIAFRVQHNNALGPMKGGLRYHPSVDESDVQSLASLMTWKTSLLRLPYGGAKGGICCDPKTLSSAELERITKAFTGRIKDVIGPYVDIMAPDVNTNAQVMAWITSEYEKYNGFEPAIVTGKPVFLYGSEGRDEATGRGISIIADCLLQLRNKVISEATIVIQGFGNVGYNTARILHEKGAKVAAISDVNQAIYSAQGIDIPSLKLYYDKHQSFKNFPGAQEISHEQLLATTCDILIPAALGDIFNKTVAENVDCQFIIEGANAPTLPEGDEVFNKRGIIVVPDILANAGGVTVSYFEWVQNIQQFRWTLDQVNSQLMYYMTDAFNRVITTAQSKNCTLREAAFLIGLGRVIRAILTKGL